MSPHEMMQKFIESIVGRDEDFSPAALDYVVDQFVDKHGPDSARKMAHSIDRFARFFEPDYQGKVSLPAHQVLQHGPEITARVRRALVQMRDAFERVEG